MDTNAQKQAFLSYSFSFHVEQYQQHSVFISVLYWWNAFYFFFFFLKVQGDGPGKFRPQWGDCCKGRRPNLLGHRKGLRQFTKQVILCSLWATLNNKQALRVPLAVTGVIYLSWKGAQAHVRAQVRTETTCDHGHSLPISDGSYEGEENCVLGFKRAPGL